MSQPNWGAVSKLYSYNKRMNEIFSLFSPNILMLIAITATVSGMIKGIVGFGMPMIFITSMTIFIDPNMALGILILPTLIANAWQAGRQGAYAALETLYNQRWFLALACLVLLIATQMVPLLSQTLFFLCLGVLVVIFASLMLSGWQPKGHNRQILSICCAIAAGLGGGLSGVWGPPTVMYLSKQNLEKQEQVRAQGVIYGLSAILLLLGHSKSGIVTGPVLALGAFAILPACVGTWVGFSIQDRINQRVFRITTLIILLMAGLNLIRRGFM
jgi:uncharacterized membrane protein YfcA